MRPMPSPYPIRGCAHVRSMWYNCDGLGRVTVAVARAIHGYVLEPPKDTTVVSPMIFLVTHTCMSVMNAVFYKTAWK